MNTKDFLTSVGQVMEDPLFREFIDDYFDDWDDVVASVMFLKAYQSLSKNSDPSLCMESKVNILRESMKTVEFRHDIASGMLSFMKSHAKSLSVSESNLFLLDSK